MSILSNYFTDWACEDYDKVSKEFDYIIVGGGSSGAIVAGHLSQTEDSVLVIESGTEASLSVFNIPVVTPLLQRSEVDWKYETEPQSTACFALKNNVSHWPMGKMLGGTSKLNSLVYLRGHYKDYDIWAEEGNTGWAYEDVLPHFKALENTELTSNYRGTSGPIPVSELIWKTPLAKAFIEGGKALGFKVRDLNGAQHTGFMETQVNLHLGARWSSEQQFVDRKNFKLLTSSTVHKILFKDNFEAYGILYSRFGKTNIVKARKAVILSAGVIGSPKILMLSGIGPERHLKEHGITVIQNLPVGQNLQDHITTGLDLILLNESLPLSLASVESPVSLYEYVFHGKGSWTFPGCEAVAVVHTKSLHNESEHPDLQLMLLPTGISSDGGVHLRKSIGILDKVWEEYFAPLYGQTAVSLLPILLHPKSRGEVLLKSSNPDDAPVIQPNYLTHPDDIHTLLRGIELIKKLIATEPMQKLGARLYDKRMPGCDSLEFDSTEYWICYIQHLTLTSYHPAGTCAMGSNFVVDSYLRVHHTNKLYVIDASVMPSLPSANINAAVMMIARKGAALVQEHWELLHGKSSRRPWYGLQRTGLQMCLI
ncbi:hypothetical protein L9F63_006252 [Diploptera punctata]|uniref:Glucose-methanol-choline oxidoreductase N-terminal domain-containing protein n=1 Tax=Diploptera punctata TaxID=6984 RepID=A0AAD8E4Q7_DIPPU|nr:hypothetical protein L9F63_006252 [Diploptera punctata]